MASFYEWQLVLLVLVCVVFLAAQRFIFDAAKSISPEDRSRRDAVSKLGRQYLWAYGLAMGADWLQGPYIYSVYREQHGLSEHLVALLFVLGFLTAGISAPAVGVWADQYGRKRMCMVFCITYALACAIIQITNLPLLFLGRFLGGFSTAILFSCFESWLVSSANTLSLSSHDLSTIFGHASLVNSVAATLAGVASNKLVEYSAILSSPFMASGLLFVFNLGIIWRTWEENFGAVEAAVDNLIDTQRLAKAWTAIRVDRRLPVLGFIQTCFEGSMYLFVFLWVPFLQEAASPNQALPLGYIFSSFMLSMTLGALLYSAIISLSDKRHVGETTDDDLERTIKFHAQLSAAVCTAAAAALMTSIASRHEHLRFWAFCAFEICVGVYYPVQGMLRGKLVPDEHRATLSSLFRVPLNVFVVVSLMTGVASARHLVLFACSLLLLFTALVTTGVFLIHPRRTALASLRVE